MPLNREDECSAKSHLIKTVGIECFLRSPILLRFKMKKTKKQKNTKHIKILIGNQFFCREGSIAEGWVARKSWELVDEGESFMS